MPCLPERPLCRVSFNSFPSSLCGIAPKGSSGEAAKPANFAAGTTQYELSQGNNSPWARRFTLDPMGLAALNPPMGSSPLRVGRCFCGVTAKVATGDPHPLTPTGRCTPVPSTKGLQPSVLPPEKADCQKHSQSAFPIFEESSIVAFFKKKNRCISLLRKTHRFFAQTFIA